MTFISKIVAKSRILINACKPFLPFIWSLIFFTDGRKDNIVISPNTFETLDNFSAIKNAPVKFQSCSINSMEWKYDDTKKSRVLLIQGVKARVTTPQLQSSTEPETQQITEQPAAVFSEPSGSSIMGRVKDFSQRAKDYFNQQVQQVVLKALYTDFQISINDVELECTDQASKIYSGTIALNSVQVDVSKPDMEHYLINACIDRLTTKVKVDTSNSALIAVVDKVNLELGHQSSTPLHINCKVGDIDVKAGDQPVIFTSTDWKIPVLDMNFTFDKVNRSFKGDLISQYVNTLIFPESVALMKGTIEKIMSEIMHPTSVPVPPVPINVWQQRPWTERFPQLETVLRPPTVASIVPSNDIAKSITIRLANIKCGVGSARIAGNADPLFTAELNGSFNLKSDSDSQLTLKTRDLLIQTSYLNRNREVVQPLFEAGGLGLTVAFEQLNHLSSVSINIPRRVEMIVTPRLMELGMLTADAFLKTLNPVDEQSTITVDPNQLTIIDPPLPQENGMAVVVRNALPFNLQVSLACHPDESVDIMTGKKKYLAQFDDNAGTSIIAKLNGYMDKNWEFRGQVNQRDRNGKWTEFQPCLFQSINPPGESITLGLHTHLKGNHLQMTFFSPVWVINNTSLDLCYHQDTSDNAREIEHSKLDNKPKLMNLGIKGLKIRTKNGIGWTKVPMTKCGKVICETEHHRSYPIGVDIHYNCEGLTKQIILTPYLILANSAPFSVQVRETSTKEWITLEPNSQVPFWPLDPDNRKLVFRIMNSQTESRDFPYEENPAEDRVVILPIENDQSGITIDTRSMPFATIICCQPIDLEKIPLVLINDFRETVQFRVPNEATRFNLESQQSRYFTWTTPDNNVLQLYNQKGNLVSRNLLENPSSLKEPGCNSLGIGWVTFLYGRQRFLLVTCNIDLIHRLDKNAGFNAQPAIFQMHLAVEEFGLNLISDELGDVLYLSIDTDRDSEYVIHPGIKFDLMLGPQFTLMDLQVEKIQLDCQMDDIVYQTILKQSDDLSDGPYLSLSMYQTLEHFQDIRLKLGPTDVCIELQVALELRNIIMPRISLIETLKFENKLVEDRLLAAQNFDERTAHRLEESIRFAFDNLEVELSKIVVSFATVKSTDLDTSKDINPLLRIMSQLVEFTDVELKLKPLHWKSAMLNQTQITRRAISHLCLGALRNAFNLTSGLGMAGKFIHLLQNITRGLENLICDPLTRAVSSRKNYRRKLHVGFRKFFSRSFGGLAGFMADMTDGLGQGIDSLTGDVMSQRRRIKIGRRTVEPVDKMVQSCNALITGIQCAVKGLFRFPMEGAKMKGVWGGIMGAGVGVVGFLTKPATGFINCVSGFCRSAQFGCNNPETDDSNFGRKRPPRFMQKTGIIPPYDRNTAEGFEIFKRVEALAENDTFVGCAKLKMRDRRPRYLIVTNNQIAVISGNGNIKWTKPSSEVTCKPEVISESGEEYILVRFASHDKHEFNCFNSEGLKDRKLFQLAEGQEEFKSFLRRK